MKVLSEKEMKNCSTLKVSMKFQLNITHNKSNNAMKVSTVNLQQIIEKLMYIACKMQSNIVFMIEYLSQNFNDIKIEHIKAVK